MMTLKTLRNRADAKEIRDTINYNFNALSEALKSNEGVKYTQNISASDWIDNRISISSSKHGVEAPTVQLFMGDEGSFDIVLGGVKIDSEYNITLSTDLPFNGKVVIK